MIKTQTSARFELSAANKSWFGKQFSSRWDGAHFVLGDGRCVRFGKCGRNRSRRYYAAVLSS